MFRVELPMRMVGDPTHQTGALKANSGYWWEGVGYEITTAQAEELRKAVMKVVAYYTEAMDYVVSDPKILKKFHFNIDPARNQSAQTLAVESWKDPSQRGYILDRWDMAWVGVNPPKLLERNFGYMGLIESTGVVQEDYIGWLKTNRGYGDVNSFGNLKEGFIRALQEVASMRSVPAGSAIDLIVEADSERADKGMIETGQLLTEWVRLAGFKPLKISELVLDYKASNTQVSLESARNASDTFLKQLATKERGVAAGMAVTLTGPFGLHAARIPAKENAAATYPFYDIREFYENAGSRAPDYRGAVLEPEWTRLMEHKSMLPILYQLFGDHRPGHSNSSFLPAVDGKRVINGQKSFAKLVNASQGRGARVLAANGSVVNERKPFEESKRSNRYITQAFCDAVVNPDGSHKVLHVFTANGQPAAIGVRETSHCFVGGNDTNTHFVPVIVRPQASTDRSVSSYEIDSDFLGIPSATRIYRLPPKFNALKRMTGRDF